MIVVRYRHESDENYFLEKMKKMKTYLEDVIDCVESKDAEYEEEPDYDEESYSERGRMRYRGSMRHRGRTAYRSSGRYDY